MKITIEKDDGTICVLDDKTSRAFSSGLIKMWDYHKEKEAGVEKAFRDLVRVLRA